MRNTVYNKISPIAIPDIRLNKVDYIQPIW